MNNGGHNDEKLIRAAHAGRGDKPSRQDADTYQREIGCNIDLLHGYLSLNGVTVILQASDGPIGFCLRAVRPGAFWRLLIANTMLPTCDDAFFKVAPGFYSRKTFASCTGLKDNIWMEEHGRRWPGQIMAPKSVGPSDPKVVPAEEAATAATTAIERAVAHVDIEISTPSDGGISFLAPAPEGRTPYLGARNST